MFYIHKFTQKNLLNILNFTLILICVSGVHSKSCKKKSACSCETDSGHLIDLKPIAKTDGTPAYADIPDPFTQGEAYSWNPCNAFTLNDCNNVAACHEIVSGPISQFVPLGTQDTADFVYDGDVLTLTYLTSGQNDQQGAIVRLVCSESHAEFTALGQDIPPTGKYSFQLKTKYVCETSGLSVGSIILIGLAGLLVLYAIVGVLIQIFVRKESGKRIIPNVDFWTAFPAYVKDGTMFVFRRGNTRTYDKI